MDILEQVELKSYTGFSIGGPARYFVVAKSLDEIKEALSFAKEHKMPTMVLGGGTNMVVSDEGFNGLVIKIETRGMEFLEDGDIVVATVQAGEVWDLFVSKCVEKKYWGVENLSYIPGTCGAFVVQNVGAYGQDASQVVRSVQVFDSYTKTIGTMSNMDCYFAYRQSVFNTVFKGRFIVLKLTLELSKIPKPNLLYADVHRYFDPGCADPAGEHSHEMLKPEIDQIRKAIIDIRNRKFTLPSVIPNAGSFFKNMLLDERQYVELEDHFRKNFSESDLQKLQSYKNRISANKIIKIPTAFLIDLCGLKGASVGGAEVNVTQPLVIINKTKSASSDDVLQLMQLVRKAVFEKTGMLLEPETELVGFKPEILEKYLKLD